MGVNKVEFGGETLIDLTEDTVTPEALEEGVTATNAQGEKIVGSLALKKITDLSGKLWYWDKVPDLPTQTQTFLIELSSNNFSALALAIDGGSITYVNAGGAVTAYNNGDWPDEQYRLFSVTGGSAATDPELIKIVCKNAILVSDYYQPRVDPLLNTQDKQIYGAINELNEKVTASYPYSEGLSYDLSADGTYYTVYMGSCTDADINIPSIYKGLPVQSIGYAAFSGRTSITSVKIPKSVTTIDTFAFVGCTNLTRVEIPASVSTILHTAFDTGYSSLTIYCEAESQPSGWHSNWNPGNIPVIWGVANDFIAVNDKIEKLANGGSAPMTSITYSELKALRDNSQLVPGMSYRITDYVCTTTQGSTRAVDNRFDIVVVAIATNTLSEIASAMHHEGDTYFAEADITAWEIKYCLDNDTSRFIWADEENGKGVIYYMKDEYNNECPYDFKNIQFSRLLNENGELDTENGTETWCYTFGGKHCDRSIRQEGLHTYNNNSISTCYYGCDEAFSLPENVFLSTNECMTKNNRLSMNCSYNTFGNACQHNTFGNECNNITFGFDCYNNTVGNGCAGVTLGDQCHNNTFGNEDNYITFGNECYRNTFGSYCSGITFGNSCGNNAFGNSCDYSRFGNYCCDNALGNDCYNITFGNECCNNILNNGTNDNTFSDGYCNYNPNAGGGSGASNGFEMPQIRFANATYNDVFQYVTPSDPLTLTVEIVGGGALQVGDKLQICAKRSYGYKKLVHGEYEPYYKQKLRCQWQREITEEDLGKRFLTITTGNNVNQWLYKNDRYGMTHTLSPFYMRIKRVSKYSDGGAECDAIFSNVATVWKTYNGNSHTVNIK